jgi:hypothetical protein
MKKEKLVARLASVADYLLQFGYQIIIQAEPGYAFGQVIVLQNQKGIACYFSFCPTEGIYKIEEVNLTHPHGKRDITDHRLVDMVNKNSNNKSLLFAKLIHRLLHALWAEFFDNPYPLDEEDN